MKKLLAGVVIGVVLAIPLTVLAGNGYPANSNGKLVGGIGCTVVIGDDGKSYPDRCDKSVFKLRDGQNTCYVTNTGAISCLRDN